MGSGSAYVLIKFSFWGRMENKFICEPIKLIFQQNAHAAGQRETQSLRGKTAEMNLLTSPTSDKQGTGFCVCSGKSFN